MMIARPDSMKYLIVYKHPDSNIRTYSRLTVDLDECAVFFKSGSPPTVGALPSGRYPLSTENIPFLNNFVTSFTGGNIFQAEVFFRQEPAHPKPHVRRPDDVDARPRARPSRHAARVRYLLDGGRRSD